MRSSDSLPAGPRRLLGLAMIGVVVAVLGLCVASYNRAFSSHVPVTVHVAAADNSFLPNAEVRFHNVAVGTVDSAEVRDATAVLHLKLDSDQVGHIPANVRAMILPKSLFGESYLSLQLPPDAEPARERLAAGADIPRDRSGRAVQVEQLFSHLLPVIQAVRPADLANALGGLSMGLTNRGQLLGDTATQLHQYLSRFNTSLPDLTADVQALPPFADLQSQALPDLIQAAHTADTTSDTLVERHDDFAKLYHSVNDASDELRHFVNENDDTIIDLARTARPTLDLLARYSPEYVCLFRRLAAAVPVGKKVFGEGSDRPALRVQVTITTGRGKFRPHQDEPEITDDRGPKCYDNTPPIQQYPGGPAEDGSTHPAQKAPGSGLGLFPFTGTATVATAPPAPVAPGAASIPMLGGSPTNAAARRGTSSGSGPPILLHGAERIVR